MDEIDELLPEELALLERFFTVKTRAGKKGMRIVGCLCHQPDGVVKRRARDRYLPMPWQEAILSAVVLDGGGHLEGLPWGIYDRKEARFLDTTTALALPGDALMSEKLAFH